MEIRLFFIIILISSIASIYFVKIDKATLQKQSERAIFEFKNFEAYSISTIATELIVDANIGKFFSKKLELYDANITRFNPKMVESIVFVKATLKDGVLNLRDVIYRQNSILSIKADDINYSIKNEVANSSLKFQLEYFAKNRLKHSFSGIGFEYQRGTFLANRIKATIELR